MGNPLNLREAFNVADLKKRDALVRRLKRIRAEAVLDVNTINHWNRTHPDFTPVSAEFFLAIIAWCDGKGPFPDLPAEDKGKA